MLGLPAHCFCTGQLWPAASAAMEVCSTKSARRRSAVVRGVGMGIVSSIMSIGYGSEERNCWPDRMKLRFRPATLFATRKLCCWRCDCVSAAACSVCSRKRAKRALEDVVGAGVAVPLADAAVTAGVSEGRPKGWRRRTRATAVGRQQHRPQRRGALPCGDRLVNKLALVVVVGWGDGGRMRIPILCSIGDALLMFGAVGLSSGQAISESSASSRTARGPRRCAHWLSERS